MIKKNIKNEIRQTRIPTPFGPDAPGAPFSPF